MREKINSFGRVISNTRYLISLYLKVL